MADDVQAAVAGKDLVIEAIIEDVAAKQALFRQLDAAAEPEAILATNTTTIPIETLAEVVSPARRGNVIGIHFQLPAHVNELVEIVVGMSRSLASTGKVALMPSIVHGASRP